MVADRGPRTRSHRFFAVAKVRYALDHCLAITFFMAAADLNHICIQALICSIGIDTLGSAFLVEFLRNAQAKMDVLQALAPASPVASVILDLHLSMLEGDIPTAVCPYS